VQGLNIVASVFLYVMPEVDAFYALRQFITHHCPLYYKKTPKDSVRLLPPCSGMHHQSTNVRFAPAPQEKKSKMPAEGEENHNRSWAVDAALYLLDQCLQVVDPGLHHHLKISTTHLYLYTQCTHALLWRSRLV
jgi:hypothetical protein